MMMTVAWLSRTLPFRIEVPFPAHHTYICYTLMFFVVRFLFYILIFRGYPRLLRGIFGLDFGEKVCLGYAKYAWRCRSHRL